MTCEAVDAVARDYMTQAGIGELFIHRIGHGIGLQSHEEPYLVSGNARVLEPGMAFSIEPGFYVEGRFGARIEDIVICTPEGVQPVNHRPHHLQIIG
jgi:Xaa-Pro aminopeptidase